MKQVETEIHTEIKNTITDAGKKDDLTERINGVVSGKIESATQTLLDDIDTLQEIQEINEESPENAAELSLSGLHEPSKTTAKTTSHGNAIRNNKFLQDKLQQSPYAQKLSRRTTNFKGMNLNNAKGKLEERLRHGKKKKEQIRKKTCRLKTGI